MECRGTAGAECAGWLWPARARRRGVVLQGWLAGARNQPLDWMGAVQGLVQTRQRAQTAFAILSLLRVLLPLLLAGRLLALKSVCVVTAESTGLASKPSRAAPSSSRRREEGSSP